MTDRRAMSLKYILPVGLIAGALLFQAEGLAQDKVGTTGAQFLEIGVSPRADALGKAFTAISDDVSAVYYNPAGLVQLDHTQTMYSYINYVADINFHFIGACFPGAGGMLGFAFYGLDAGNIPVTTYQYQYGADGWTFGAQDFAVSMSYARFLTDRFSVGGTVKFVGEFYEEEEAMGWAADVGTQYNTGFRNFKIVMMLSNFGPDMKFFTDEYPLPINFKFGGAIDVVDGPQHHATFAVEGAHPADNRERYNAGVEYTFQRFASLRIGQRIEHDLGGISYGGGLVLESMGVPMKFDYGYQDFEALNAIHRFSFTFDL